MQSRRRASVSGAAIAPGAGTGSLIVRDQRGAKLNFPFSGLQHAWLFSLLRLMLFNHVSSHKQFQQSV
jgi:hypothetical protein